MAAFGTGIQSAQNSNATSSIQATLSAAPTVGNTLIAAISANVTNTAFSMTGWTKVHGADWTSGRGIATYYRVVQPGDATTVARATATGATAMDIVVVEIAGRVGASDVVFDATPVASGTSMAIGPTAATAVANEFAFAMAGFPSGPGAVVGWTNGFTNIPQATRLLAAGKSLSATGTQSTTVTWTTSRAAGGMLITFTEAAPTVTAVSPSSGSTAGGTSVTVTGTGFGDSTGVKFGTNPATGIVIVSDTSLTCASPAGSAGTVDVTVTAPGGTSATGASDQFTYNAPAAGLGPGGEDLWDYWYKTRQIQNRGR